MVLSDVVSVGKSAVIDVSETLEFTDTVVKTGSIGLDEDLVLSDSTAKIMTIGLNETLSFDDVIAKTTVVGLSEDLVLSDSTV